ncbi:hypothetical protein F4776DRAFT_604038 [Hypoxylon sp. NC0597]|nr:hypothetical protein F4776DRAFT_604038 [Hypoxylon sp. NC0597]
MKAYALISVALLAVGVPVTLAQEDAGGEQLDTRAAQKFNQYALYSDCRTDEHILYHKAPRSGECIKIDEKTGSFFYNTGGLKTAIGYTAEGCHGGKKFFPAGSDGCQPVTQRIGWTGIAKIKSFKMS